MTEFLPFPVLRAQPGELAVVPGIPAPFAGRRLRGIAELAAPVLDVGVVEPLAAQQLPAAGAALGQFVEGGHDPRLVRHREGPPLRPARLAAAHLTIMPGDSGMVSQCHSHGLISPASPCLTTEGYLRPASHRSLTERVPVP